MTETVSVRVSKEDLVQIEELSKLEKKNKSAVLREALDKGLKEKKLEIALKKYQDEEVTLGTAAKMAGLSLYAFMDILSERKISFHYGLKELEQDFEGLI